jgi:hypothetical protein
MRRNLTAKLIENLKPATDRRYEVRDALLPGFGIRVSVAAANLGSLSRASMDDRSGIPWERILSSR